MSVSKLSHANGFNCTPVPRRGQGCTVLSPPGTILTSQPLLLPRGLSMMALETWGWPERSFYSTADP